MVAVFLDGPERMLGGDAAPHRAAHHPRPRPDGRAALRNHLLASTRGGVSVLSVPLANWARLANNAEWQDEWLRSRLASAGLASRPSDTNAEGAARRAARASKALKAAASAAKAAAVSP
jgi:hypothetical protein